VNDVRAVLARDGFVRLAGAFDPDDPVADPWSFVAALVGSRPRMVERQAIRPLDGGRSFASTMVETPLHTDSQDFLGAPPGLQVMACRRPANDGGVTRLLDGFALVEAVRTESPSLYRALLTEHRTIPFYFGAVRGPTVAEKGGSVTLTVSPVAPATDDRIGAALSAFLARGVVPVRELAIARGDVLLVDNHRMLHGRSAFSDRGREFVRLLAWLDAPLATTHAFFGDVPRAPEPSPADRLAAHRAAVVIELMGGVAPARLATREGVSEATIYAWRSAFFRGGLAALAEDGVPFDSPRARG